MYANPHICFAFSLFSSATWTVTNNLAPTCVFLKIATQVQRGSKYFWESQKYQLSHYQL